MNHSAPEEDPLWLLVCESVALLRKILYFAATALVVAAIIVYLTY